MRSGPSGTRDGPAWTDLDGSLQRPVLKCTGCKHLAHHDWHYPYCSAQQGDSGDYPWPGAGKHIGRETPNAGCPYSLPPAPALATPNVGTNT